MAARAEKRAIPTRNAASTSAIQGNTAKASAACQDFLTLWKDADPNIPVLLAATYGSVRGAIRDGRPYRNT
jgi:hypothetical protein